MFSLSRPKESPLRMNGVSPQDLARKGLLKDQSRMKRIAWATKSSSTAPMAEILKDLLIFVNATPLKILDGT